MRRVGLLLLVTLGTLAGAPVARAETTGRILVSLTADDAPRAHAASVIARASARRAGPSVPQIGLVTVRPAPGRTLAQTLRKLRADPRVRVAQREGRMKLRAQPDDPALVTPEATSGAPPGATLQWAAERQGFFGAWDVARGDGAVVAVIDTGVDAEHPELRDKVAAALDLDSGSSAPATTDADGHGTHVASLACAATGNAIGIAGAGYNCRLLVISTDLSDASIAQAIVEAAARGAHALNMSFGDTGEQRSQAIADAIDFAVARNVVLVAAAADEPTEEQGEPANLLQPPGTAADLAQGRGLTVTAADAGDQRASFAGRGEQISLAAYGALRSSQPIRGIFAPYPGQVTPRENIQLLPPAPPCRCRAQINGDDRYAVLAGTSMAAPQVAGVASLLRTLNPDLSALEVVRLLKETARRPQGSGWEPELGWGIIDAAAAVEAARRIDRRAPTSRARVPRNVRGRRLTVRWSGSDPAPKGLIASGIQHYDVYRALPGKPARRIARTRRTSLRLHVVRGRRYLFHTIAVDQAGNREAAPARGDATVRVAG